MRYCLNRHTIPRMLRRHKVGFMIGLGYGGISAVVLAGADQTAIRASRPGVSVSWPGASAWRSPSSWAWLACSRALSGSP
jgi:hypothetical protein